MQIIQKLHGAIIELLIANPLIFPLVAVSDKAFLRNDGGLGGFASTLVRLLYPSPLRGRAGVCGRLRNLLVAASG